MMAAVEPIQIQWEEFAEERGSIKTILSGPCPCDTCNEIVRWQCSQNAACRDFSTFVNTGKILIKDRTPTRERWHRIFRGSDGEAGESDRGESVFEGGWRKCP